MPERLADVCKLESVYNTKRHRHIRGRLDLQCLRNSVGKGQDSEG